MINGCRLEMTCGSCPEQYNVYLGERQIGYLCLRHGMFTASYPDVDGHQVYAASTRGDGNFEDNERMYHLSLAVAMLKNNMEPDDKAKH